MAIFHSMVVVLGLVSVTNGATPTVTGTFKPTTPGACDISMKAFGWVDTGANMVKSAYIKVNGLTYIDSFNGNFDYRGFNLVALDVNTCKASNFGHFDTLNAGAPSDGLAKYIYDIPDGTHILAVTSDDGFNGLQPNAKIALKSIGVDTEGMVYADKLIFHAIKGKPSKAIVKKAPTKGENLFYEEKAPTCILCQNGGTLKVNSAGNGFECQCLKIYSGLYCENLSEAGCLEQFSQTDQSVKASKRNLIPVSYAKNQ